MINFQPAAVAKVKELMLEENEPTLKLRIFVSGGGCQGFQYGFTFDEVINEDDSKFEIDGVTFLVDSMSFQYLQDATIDYKEDLMGASFSINNPSAVSQCGCGSSFSM